MAGNEVLNLNCVEQEKRNKRIDTAVFLVLLILFSVLMLRLFYLQCTGTEQQHHSDMKAYMLEMQGLDSGYSFPYPILFWVGRFFNLFLAVPMAMAMATMVLNSAALVAVKWVLNQMALTELQQFFGKKSVWAGILISVVSLSLFMVSMVYPPGDIYLPGIIRDYLGVFSPNPHHNATYMAARPFAVVAFFWFTRILDKYEQGYSGKWKGGKQGVDLQAYLMFSVSLLLATMAKPSFTIILVGAAGLLMVYRLIRSRFQNFMPTLWLGLCFVPTFIDLLYQYSGVFVPQEGEEGGIGFTLGVVWSKYCENIPLAIGLAAGFPILVLILNIKELKKNSFFRFGWQVYTMGLSMAFFLLEKGFRQWDFNFCWGYMYGIFFAFLGAVVVLLRATARKERPILLSLQWMALGWHLLCGIYYFMVLYDGVMYYSIRW